MPCRLEFQCPQTTRTSRRPYRVVGSNPGLATTYTELERNGERIWHNGKSRGRYHCPYLLLRRILLACVAANFPSQALHTVAVAHGFLSQYLFPSVTTKNRKSSVCKLPQSVLEVLTVDHYSGLTCLNSAVVGRAMFWQGSVLYSVQRPTGGCRSHQGCALSSWPARP